jgi:hypothetical protein
MSKGLWHFLVIGFLVVILILVAYIAWRFWRLRHPVVVYVPPPEPMEQVQGMFSELVDINMATRGHVSSAADSVAKSGEVQKLEARRIAAFMRKIAQALGLSTDDVP